MKKFSFTTENPAQAGEIKQLEDFFNGLYDLLIAHQDLFGIVPYNSDESLIDINEKGIDRPQH